MAEARQGPLALAYRHWRPIAGVCALVAVLNVAVRVAFVRGMVETSGNSEAILAKEQSHLGQVRSEVAGLERITSKLACTRSDVDRIFDETLSSKIERMTSIQREIRDLARERHIDPDAIAYTAGPVKDTGLVRFQITFPLAGSYETLEDFIKAVEASKNFLIVQDITMQESPGAALRLSIQIATYFQAPKDDETASTLPGGGPT